MNIIHCASCEKTEKIIEELLSKYTEDWHKYYRGTLTERMYEAGRRSVLI